MMRVFRGQSNGRLKVEFIPNKNRLMGNKYNDHSYFDRLDLWSTSKPKGCR